MRISLHIAGANISGQWLGTVKPVLRDHCHERPPVVKEHQFGTESPTFQCK